MESIPNDPFIKFRPNTLIEVRKEFNLHQPGAIEEVIKSFEEWIQKQAHFTKKDFNKHFLEYSIILAKGSLERAKKCLDKLCTMRTLIPKFFCKYNIKSDMVDFKSTMPSIILPVPTEDQYRVYMMKVVSTDIDSKTFFDFFCYIMLMCEYMKAHDYTEGFYGVIDVRDINVVAFALKLNVLDWRDMFAAIMEGYGMRIKSIHYISESKAVDALVAVMRQILSEKVGQRIHVHKTFDTVSEHLNKDILPADYGGKEKPFLELYGKHFLELSIVLSKGSLEKAKKTLDRLCTLRTLIPKFFSKHNVNAEMVDFRTTLMPTLLPRMTNDNYRIFMLKIVSTDIDSQTWIDYYAILMLMCEYIKVHDYTQGFCAVVDVRDVNVVTLATKLNVLDMKDMFTAMIEGYGMRFKGIHYISESKTVDVLVTVIKQIVSEKLGKRIHVHKTVESVYEHVDKDLLPQDYGGKVKPFIELYEDMRNLLSKKENVEYFKDICQSGTNEKFRQTSTYNNDILGMPGSFRSLTVD